MEDDKKKRKKSKKKKNKLGEATTDDVPVSGNGQPSNPADNGQIPHAAAGDVHSEDVSVAGNGKGTEAVVDVRSDGLHDGDVNRNGHERNGTETSKRNLLAESEKQRWLQKEAAYEETIKQLEMEKDVYIQKEANLEEAIRNGNDSHLQKQATLEDTIKRLQNENDSLMQKEATLEYTIKQLRDEKNSHIQKEGIIQMELLQLQNEKVSWLQKEVRLEEKIGRLVDEKGTLSSQEACLQEKVKHLKRDRDTRVLKEDSFKEVVTTLNDNITILRTQVLELEQSRDNLVQENQQLIERLSSLQFQIKNFESVSSTPSSDELAKHASEREALSSQVEAAFALVEKLVADNAELVEKVSALSVELDGKSAKVDLSSTTASDTTVLPPETASVLSPLSGSNEDETISDKKLDSLEVVSLTEEVHSNGNMDSQRAASVPHWEASDEISAIVQIPLDENEEQNVDMQMQSTENDENAAVPITDAPLIGAPFRFMSFVARYVSGADLVNKDTTKL